MKSIKIKTSGVDYLRDERLGDEENNEKLEETSTVDAPITTPSEEKKDGDNHNEDAPVKITPRGLTSDQYLAGSAIAFSLGLFIMLVVGWGLQIAGVEMTVSVVLAINIIPTMIGSGVSTFLFTRRSRRNYVVDGAKFGIGGFLITFVYTSLLGQGVGGAYILTGFLIGGILGGFITKQIFEKP